MDYFVTQEREWTRGEVAQLLISKTALAEFTADHALQIVRLLKAEEVAAGTVLIEEGVNTTGFMALVLEGEAVVANSIPGQGESIVLSQLGAGALFGELGVLDGEPRSATVTAVTDMVIAVLDRQALARLIDTMPKVACELLNAIIVRVGARLRATNLRVQELSTENAALRARL